MSEILLTKWAENYFYTLNYFNPLKNYFQSQLTDDDDDDITVIYEEKYHNL